jgi:hypothetical protein
MKKASSSFLLAALAALFVSLQSYAQISTETGRPRRGQYRPHPAPRPIPETQQNRILEERMQLSLRPYERLRLSELLRVSWQEEQELEVLSLRFRAQAVPFQGLLEVSGHGRILTSRPLGRMMEDISVTLPPGTLLGDLQISATSEIFLSVITAQVQSIRRPSPGPGYEQQVSPNSLITLRVNQPVRGWASLSLTQLVRSQLGMTLEGAQIERVVVEGQSFPYGRAASVQVELNQRIVSELKYLDQGRMVPLPVFSGEEVRNLSLLVQGDAQIMNVRIRVGQVLSRAPEISSPERVFVQREILPRQGLTLGELMPFESRLISSLRIDGRATRSYQTMISILGLQGELQGSAVLGSNPTQVTIHLSRPMSAREIRLDSTDRALINALDIEFHSYSRY